MSVPNILVYVGFQQTTGFAQPFQLDNATYGLLDTGTLGGIQMIDVTAKAMSVSVKRGRNRDTETFNAGTATVVFKDPDRQLDPLNESSPYYPYVLPRQPIVIYASNGTDVSTAEPIFTGIITDWNLEYDYTTSGNVMVAQCADNFAVLANIKMDKWTPIQQSSGDRVSNVLTRPDVLYQGGWGIGTTWSTLGAYEVPDGTTVLNYLQNVMQSEAGYLFMDRYNALAFRGRNYVLNPTPTFEFTEDGTGIPYMSLTNIFGDELLYNSVQMQSPAGAVQTADDATSQALYQVQLWSKLDLLNSTTTEVQGLANLFLGSHKDPQLRFTSITVLLNDVDEATRQDLFGLELIDVISVQKSYDVGSPASVEKILLVSGIEHQATPGNYSMRIICENIDQQAYFTLDSAVLGLLDNNILAL